MSPRPKNTKTKQQQRIEKVLVYEDGKIKVASCYCGEDFSNGEQMSRSKEEGFQRQLSVKRFGIRTRAWLLTC